MTGPVSCVLGIDPGDTTGMLLAGWPAELAGLGRLRPADGAAMVFAKAFQCDRASAADLLIMIILRWHRPLDSVIAGGGIEAFVSGPGSAKLHGTRPGPIRDEIGELISLAGAHGIILAARPAVTVKGWATDERLRAAGLYEVTAGQPHARDGGRHGLYRAVRDMGLPDPLSRKGRAMRLPSGNPARAAYAAVRGSPRSGPLPRTGDEMTTGSAHATDSG